MTGKIYKTSQGQTVDMGSLMLKNENVPAVGNMGVTAAGKKIERPVVHQEQFRSNPRNTQPGRRTNVVKQVPDATSQAAKERLAAEAERLKTLAAAQFITTTPEPVEEPAAEIIASAVAEAIADAVAEPLPVPEITPVSTKTESVVDPLAVTLDTPTKSGGLADAIARVQTGGDS